MYHDLFRVLVIFVENIHVNGKSVEWFVVSAEGKHGYRKCNQ
jgi:hypothetical protein